MFSTRLICSVIIGLASIAIGVGFVRTRIPSDNAPIPGGPVSVQEGLPSLNDLPLLIEEPIPSDDELIARVRGYEHLKRITVLPHPMDAVTSEVCGILLTPASKVEISPIELKPRVGVIVGTDVRFDNGDTIPFDVHEQRHCDVFVSEGAFEILGSGEGTYPRGTLIVKAKYPDSKRDKIELFTVMQKMHPGFSPDHGDWEFSVVDAKINHIVARGAISSCISCHDNYAATDFVTRAYMEK